MRGRPQRTRLPDFSGRLLTLPVGPESWRALGDGEDVLLLGLGPEDPAKLPFVADALRRDRRIFWLEAPAVRGPLQVDAPCGWHAVTPGEALSLARNCAVYFYSPGLRLAPSFWSPLLARLDLARCQPPARCRMAWLPGSAKRLLHLELLRALADNGYETVSEAEPEATAHGLLSAWNGRRPELAVSVNFRGLDPDGRIFSLCQELSVPLAVWLVDNPWNILSGIPLPWWKRARIFVTDQSFIAGLEQCGAQNVHYLPLATGNHMLGVDGASGSGSPLFVGSSAFAGRDSFFAGLKIDTALLAEAQTAERPDFHWWQEKYCARLWPGRDARKPAFGADMFSRLRRSAWVGEAAHHGLVVAGDSGWRGLLPDVAVAPPVDYYGTLARLYGEAACVLNVTSLLLPQSLNQRHFDVWAAGGFLLTDYTRGLEIFPRELVEPVILENAGQFQPALERLAASPGHKNDLAQAWRSLIAREHTYAHRLRTIMACLGI